jgi:ABC-type multidrug transport system permease subunit
MVNRRADTLDFLYSSNSNAVSHTINFSPFFDFHHQPQFWMGLVLAAVFLYIAVQLRRRSEPL